LELAAEAGARFSGVLCGRATWKDGVPVFATQGMRALEDWLHSEGVRNIQRVNARLEKGIPWFTYFESATRASRLSQQGCE
jgi:tagatose 1,6-diphosphate aldolase